MKIADGVEMLELIAERPGGPMTIHPTLIWDRENVFLVDTGFPGQLPQIKEGFKRAGVPFERLIYIIITHHDLDHMGGLADIRRERPVEVLAHEVEKDYLDGTKTPLKLAQLQANLGNLPEDMKTSYSVMSRVYQENPVRVDRTLTDGEKLPYAGGITIIHTPGHTLGHISLYLEASKTLVSGDELRIENGVLGIPPERINHDTAEVVRSLKKLSQYDIERVICYHGGLYQNQPSQRIAELVQA